MRRPLPRERRLPLTRRLSPEHPAYRAIIAAHEQAMRLGQPGYLDPASGYFVFTAAEHWERGNCCASGCRHCPYAAGPREEGGAVLGAQAEPGTE
jgi:hypothetical protein